MTAAITEIPSRLRNVSSNDPFVAGADDIDFDKPASTGTTGDYPYNGLGRIVLKKKYSENSDYANQPILEQADFDDDSNNHLTNMVFVIKYDFVLTEDITLGSGCVLEFEGGSISGDGNSADTITLNNATFEGEVVKFTNVALSGTLTNKTIKLSWFGGSIANMVGIDPSNHIIAFDIDITADATLEYSDKSNIIFDGCNKEITVGANMKLFLINGSYSNIEVKNFVFKGTTSSTFCDQNSGGLRKNIHIHHNVIDTCFLGISLNSDVSGETKYCSVHDNVIKCNQLEDIIGEYGIHIANANYSNFYNNYVSGCCRHAFYHAWGHDNNIFNNVFEDNDIGVEGTVATLAVLRKSENVNIYSNKFLNNNATEIMVYHQGTEYDDEEHTIENRRTKGNLRNINIYDNLIDARTRIAANGIMVGYFSETDYKYMEEQIQIHHNTFLAGAEASIGNSIVLTSGKNIEVTDNLFIWENGTNFASLKGHNTLITFRQHGSLMVPAQDILQDFTIKNNVFDGPSYSSFDYYIFFMKDLRSNPVFMNGIIKDNIMRGLFEITEATAAKMTINPTTFPKADDAWMKIGNTSQRPALTDNTKWYEYYDYQVGKPIYWCGDTTKGDNGWIDATGNHPNPQ